MRFILTKFWGKFFWVIAVLVVLITTNNISLDVRTKSLESQLNEEWEKFLLSDQSAIIVEGNRALDHFIPPQRLGQHVTGIHIPRGFNPAVSVRGEKETDTGSFELFKRETVITHPGVFNRPLKELTAVFYLIRRDPENPDIVTIIGQWEFKGNQAIDGTLLLEGGDMIVEIHGTLIGSPVRHRVNVST